MCRSGRWRRRPVGRRRCVRCCCGAARPAHRPGTRPIPNATAVAVELAGVGEPVDDGLVEPVDEVVGAGQQHRVDRPASRAANQRSTAAAIIVVRVVGDDDAAVGEVGVDGAGDGPVAQLGERGLFPRLALAAVDGQLGDAAGVVGGGGEPAAGADLGELVVVADQQHPAPGGDLAR